MEYILLKCIIFILPSLRRSESERVLAPLPHIPEAQQQLLIAE
jgi:hypothetical protein